MKKQKEVKKIQKVKKPSVFKLKKKLWAVYSEYIRLSHADENGMVKCVACKKEYKWAGTGDLHCGHFFSKKFYASIMFDEMNTKPLCNSCNRKQSSGEGYLFHLFLIESYGHKAIRKLYEKGCIKTTYKADWLLEKLEYYTAKLKILKASKKIL